MPKRDHLADQNGGYVRVLLELLDHSL